jgi:glutathione S-transferase
MRARLGLLLASQSVMLRDIVMKDIPAELFAASAKGSVPVLVFADSSVIDESLDIMLWALNQSDPNNLLYREQVAALQEMLILINRNDNEFVEALKKYKAAARYHDSAEITCRQQCGPFIETIEERLTKHDFVMGTTPSLADFAILPFIRQFSRVDRKWYLHSPYPNLRRWLERQYQNPVFSKAMVQYPLWLDSRTSILFGNKL